MAKKENVVYLTQEGLDELKAELDDLINVKRPENSFYFSKLVFP